MITFFNFFCNFLTNYEKLMGKATGWGDFQKNWHLEHPNASTGVKHGKLRTELACLKQYGL